MLDIESEILARLAAEVDDVHLLTSSALDDVSRGRALAPAVYVVYDGGDLGEPDDYRTLRIEQRWVVVCTTRNAAQDGGTTARSSAADLADEVLAALSGWTPASATGPMLLSGLPRPGYITGYQTFPLEFTVAIERPLVA
jgi:hypothetical protein